MRLRRSGPAEPSEQLDLGAVATGIGERPDRLAALDPRVRLIGAAMLAVTLVSLTSLTSAVVALLAAIALALLGGVPVRRLQHLLPLELLMLLLLITLPFSVPGKSLLEIGSLSASAEGLRLAGLILLKANAVVLSLFGLVAVLGASQVVHALARLGVPAKLCHLLLLTLRQILLVGDEYRRMRLAMRARAFVPRSDRHSWRALGWLIGMLLVRSLARGQRLGEAMRCRGFDGRLHLLHRGRWRRLDSLVLAVAVSVCVALFAFDRWSHAA
jgi:cobalt/nickel transport system permease protein